MLFMSWVTLPITVEVVGGGRPIEEMPSMVGWGTFSVEHALFGLVLGAFTAAARTTVVAPSAEGDERRLAT
jgi:hypothetical protein